jgi:hypothetical protein
VNANCKCGKILRPGYIRCWSCELTAERSAPEVAEDSSVTAAERATPETDAVWTDKSRNILTHSKNLERQRDEVVAELTAEGVARKALIKAMESCLRYAEYRGSA